MRKKTTAKFRIKKKMAPLSRENSGVKAPADGPQPIEIVFSFDTTGSMGSCIAEVEHHFFKNEINLSKTVYIKLRGADV